MILLSKNLFCKVSLGKIRLHKKCANPALPALKKTSKGKSEGCRNAVRCSPFSAISILMSAPVPISDNHEIGIGAGASPSVWPKRTTRVS